MRISESVDWVQEEIFERDQGITEQHEDILAILKYFLKSLPFNKSPHQHCSLIPFVVKFAFRIFRSRP